MANDWWEDWVKPAGSWLNDNLNPFSGGKMDRGKEYAGVDRNNFNLPPGAAGLYGDVNAFGQRMGGYQAPQVGSTATAATSDFRARQMALADQLERRASGQESISAQQLRAGADRNMAQQMSMAAGARPGNAALAARGAAANMGQIGQGLAGQQAIAGIAERQGAQDMLGGVLQGARGQDEGLAQFNAGQQNQMGQFNVGAQLQALGITSQAQLDAFRQQLAQHIAQQQGGIAYEANRASRYGAAMGTPTNTERLLGLGYGIASIPGLL